MAPSDIDFTPLPHYIPSSPRDSCIDALHRWTQGIDDASPDLVRSAFTSDTAAAIFDTRPWTKQPSGLYRGVDNIVSAVMKSVGPMDTLHQLTNVRVVVNEKAGRARSTAYVLAQHKALGRGGDTMVGDCLMGNRYWVDLVREKVPEGMGEGSGPGLAEWWVVSRLVLENAWTTGDTSVMAQKKE